MIRPQKLLLGLAVAILAAACGGAGRPTLDDPDLRSSDEEPAALTIDAGALTGTATDLIDGATRTVSDLTDEALAGGGRHFTVDIAGARGHDEAAFTQGLEFAGPFLYESRGQYGESAITEIDPITGEVLAAVGLGEEFFAEGITIVDDRIIMLTWREGRAFVYDVDTLDQLDEFTYEGEGWGLCYDGASLFMSDGTSTLIRRDPLTFEPLETIRVTLDGVPVSRLNELECIEGNVWANVWTTDFLVVIDPASGEVLATVDASPLRAVLDDAEEAEVLNGIALDPATGGLLLTGKYWSTMFEAEVVPCTSACVDHTAALGLN